MYCSFFTGASSDFDGATKIANMMVTRFGMSDKVWLLIKCVIVSWLACIFVNSWFYDSFRGMCLMFMMQNFVNFQLFREIQLI